MQLPQVLLVIAHPLRVAGPQNLAHLLVGVREARLPLGQRSDPQTSQQQQAIAEITAQGAAPVEATAVKDQGMGSSGWLMP